MESLQQHQALEKTMCKKPTALSHQNTILRISARHNLHTPILQHPFQFSLSHLSSSTPVPAPTLAPTPQRPLQRTRPPHSPSLSHPCRHGLLRRRHLKAGHARDHHPLGSGRLLHELRRGLAGQRGRHELPHGWREDLPRDGKGGREGGKNKRGTHPADEIDEIDEFRVGLVYLCVYHDELLHDNGGPFARTDDCDCQRWFFERVGNGRAAGRGGERKEA